MSYSFETLRIDFKGRPVENTFFLKDGGSSHLAVVLPGAGYTTMAPMLYYTISSLTQVGADTLALEYGSAVRGAGESPEERIKALSEIALKGLNAALARGRYTRLTLVGKSMGTRALASLSVAQDSWSYQPEVIKSVWLTPLLSDRTVVDEIAKLGIRQFLAIGTEDTKYYKPDVLTSLPWSVEVLIQEGADHGLDVEDDSVMSIQLLNDLIQRLIRFLSQ